MNLTNKMKNQINPQMFPHAKVFTSLCGKAKASLPIATTKEMLSPTTKPTSSGSCSQNCNVNHREQYKL